MERNVRYVSNVYCLEGIDGAGKSTVIDALHKRLQGKVVWGDEARPAIPCTIVRQPYDTTATRWVRALLSDEGNVLAAISKKDKAELLDIVFTADRVRSWHNKGGVLDFVSAGGVVLLDRFVFSNYAYSDNRQNRYYDRAFDLPIVTFWLDVDPEVAHKRLRERGRALDINESLERLKVFDARYRDMYNRYQEYYHMERVDAEPSVEDVVEYMYDRIMSYHTIKCNSATLDVTVQVVDLPRL